MVASLEKDLFLLFNMAFDGLDKTNLTSSADQADLDDIDSFLQAQEDKPQVALINTRSKIYPKALLFRKIVNGKAVIFALWKRGTICEGMVTSLDGNSVLNEFIWVKNAKTGKFVATLKPKLNGNQRKERQEMMTRATISTVVVESLNRAEYKERFGGDILKKLESERKNILDGMKRRGLIPNDATDPAGRAPAPLTAAKSNFYTPDTEKHTEFIAVQNHGAMTFTTQMVDNENMADKLIRELEREALMAKLEDEMSVD